MKDEDYIRLVNMMKYYDDNIIDVLAYERGWAPLIVGERMLITINNQQYIIQRVQNIEDE